MNVSCVIPTRGDVDLSPILDSLPFEDIIVWDNSKFYDHGLFGRYLAIHQASYDVIVTQDDDVLVSCWDEILAAYEPGVLTVNYPEPWDVPWVARGAVFDRDLPFAAFRRYWEQYPADETFLFRTCDAVFALLTPHRVIDHGSVDLPHGFYAGRISTSDGWYDRDRPEAQRRCREILAA